MEILKEAQKRGTSRDYSSVAVVRREERRDHRSSHARAVRVACGERESSRARYGLDREKRLCIEASAKYERKAQSLSLSLSLVGSEMSASTRVRRASKFQKTRETMRTRVRERAQKWRHVQAVVADEVLHARGQSAALLRLLEAWCVRRHHACKNERETPRAESSQGWCFRISCKRATFLGARMSLKCASLCESAPHPGRTCAVLKVRVSGVGIAPALNCVREGCPRSASTCTAAPTRPSRSPPPARDTAPKSASRETERESPASRERAPPVASHTRGKARQTPHREKSEWRTLSSDLTYLRAATCHTPHARTHAQTSAVWGIETPKGLARRRSIPRSASHPHLSLRDTRPPSSWWWWWWWWWWWCALSSGSKFSREENKPSPQAYVSRHVARPRRRVARRVSREWRRK